MDLKQVITYWIVVLLLIVTSTIVQSRRSSLSEDTSDEVRRSRTKSKPEILGIQLGRGSDKKQEVAEACPMGCRCTAGPRLHARHHWHRILGAYRTHRLVYGPGRDDFNYVPQGNPNRPSGREMTCVGLPDMPDVIPSDVSRVVFYGSLRESWEEQKDDPEADEMVHQDTSVEGSPNVLQQLTSVSKLNAIRSAGMRHLQIQGNRIKMLYPNDFEMLTSLRHLHITNNRMKAVSQGAFNGLDHVQDIDLSENHLRHLPQSTFRGLANLKKIVLSKNRLPLLHEKLFANVGKLHHLDLSFNYITDMPKDIFLDNPRIKVLSLNDNQLRNLRPEWINHLKKLQKLNLKGNKIYEIKDNTFAKMTNLKMLNLDKNQLKEVGRDTFTGLKNLNILYLGNNNITFLQNRAFLDLSQLMELHLDYNNIDTITAETLAGLVNLQKLSIAHNRLDGMRREAFIPVQKLQYLDLSNNKIKRITNRNFYGLLDLRELRLDHNEIKSVEDDGFAVSIVNTFSKMTWLHLSFNKLNTVTRKMFTGLSYLKFLNLGHNEIEIVDENGLAVFNRINTLILSSNAIYDVLPATFKQLSHLKLLDLGTNMLRHIRFNAFLGLDNIEELSLQNNDVSSVDTGVFLDTPNLRSLNLQKNKMNSFDLNVLDRLPKLKYLDLSENTVRQVRLPSSPLRQLFSLSLADNYLQRLPINITGVVTKRGTILLYGNPWNCNCALDWLLTGETINGVHIAKADQLVCKSPRHLSGEQMLALTHDDFCRQRDADSEDEAVVDELTMAGNIACDFSQLSDGLKSQIKSHRDEPLRWIVNFFTDDSAWFCSGVRLQNNYILTPSACWKTTGTSDPIRITTGSMRSDVKPRSIAIRDIQHFTGPLDFALVKVGKLKGFEERVFPCVLDSDGLSSVMTNSTFGIVASVNQKDSKVRPFMAKSISDPCVEGFLCLTVNEEKFTGSKYHTDNIATFFKVGKSRWALASLGQLKAYGNVLTTPLTKLLPWIDTVIQ